MSIALAYHTQTKHYYNRYAKSLGYLDWEHQPNPYRTYLGATKFPLSLHSSFDLSYKELFEPKEPKDIDYKTISSFFRYALGLTAKKRFGASSWELRVNASSGNLHPTEAYCITNGIDGLEDATSLYHYNSYLHALESLYKYDFVLPDGSFIVIFSSVIYREMWKYGERCYRYCGLDFGHAYRALEVAAKLHGWQVQPLDLSERECERLTGLDQKDRFDERELESADIACIISKEAVEFDENFLRDREIERFDNVANKLTDSYQRYEIVEQMDAATKESAVRVPKMEDVAKSSLKKATEVILKRRSAQAFNPYTSTMDIEEFLFLMRGTHTQNAQIDLLIYLHSVTGLRSGLYLYKRSDMQLRLKEEFRYAEMAADLYLLQEGDFRAVAKNLSCKQDIASDSAFALSMVANFEDIAKEDIRYKERLFEAGRIGQQLYLDATSLGYAATGIGCFFDDAIHNLLGVDTTQAQVVYNFTVGKPIVDMRLQTLDPYEHLIRE